MQTKNSTNGTEVRNMYTYDKNETIVYPEKRRFHKPIIWTPIEPVTLPHLELVTIAPPIKLVEIKLFVKSTYGILRPIRVEKKLIPNLSNEFLQHNVSSIYHLERDIYGIPDFYKGFDRVDLSLNTLGLIVNHCFS